MNSGTILKALVSCPLMWYNEVMSLPKGHIPWNKGKITYKKDCLICNKEFITFLSAINRGGGKYCSKFCTGKAIAKQKLGSKNPMWKGDKVGYIALHEWIKRRIKKPTFCMKCLIRKPYDLANISQKYKRDLFDWEWLCRSCHMKKDGRIVNLKNQS